MTQFKSKFTTLIALALIVSLVSMTTGVYGAITATGDTSNIVGDLDYLPGSDTYIGDTGTGSMTITSPSVQVNVDGFVGVNSGSEGFVTVNASTWTNNGDLAIGDEGEGTLTISDGGSVSNEDAYLVLR